MIFIGITIGESSQIKSTTYQLRNDSHFVMMAEPMHTSKENTAAAMSTETNDISGGDNAGA